MSHQAVLPLVSFPASAPALFPVSTPASIPTSTPISRRKPIDPPDLAALRGVEGREVAFTTQSPAILDDLERLVELDRRCSVTVNMVLAAVDPFLVRRLEPGAADAKSRLRAVAGLAAEGIAVRILCTPLSPGLNDREPALRALMAAAYEAGAWDVIAGTAPEPASRLTRLLSGLGDALTGRRAPEADLDPRLAIFRRLKLEFGFPRISAGRG